MARAQSLDGLAFYRERIGADGTLRPWNLSDLENFAASHPDDPFAGRMRAGVAPKFSLQLEATGDPSIWVGLEPAELDRWDAVVARLWQRWGTARGETIALFEYGSSPLVLLASSGYVGYLRRGAADRLGLNAVCNDGVAAMADRMVTIIETLKPSMLVIRRDLVVPLATALEASGAKLTGRIRWIAITEVEGAISRADAEKLSTRFGVPVRRILRCDAAFLLAGECPNCRAFHLDSVYRAEARGGHVVITSKFAKACPVVGFDLGDAMLHHGGCNAEPRAQRIEL